MSFCSERYFQLYIFMVHKMFISVIKWVDVHELALSLYSQCIHVISWAVDFGKFKCVYMILFYIAPAQLIPAVKTAQSI